MKYFLVWLALLLCVALALVSWLVLLRQLKGAFSRPDITVHRPVSPIATTTLPPINLAREQCMPRQTASPSPLSMESRCGALIFTAQILHVSTALNSSSTAESTSSCTGESLETRVDLFS